MLRRPAYVSLIALATLAGCSTSRTPETDSAALAARVSFRLPLLDEDGKPLSRFNKELAKKGVAAFPDSIVVTEANAYALHEEWVQKYELAKAKLATLPESMMEYGSPSTYGYGLCYEGDGTKVGYLSEAMSDGFFSDQYSLWGWRYKQSQYRYQGMESDLTVWDEWRGNGEAVLLSYSTDDDGTETGDIVPRCKTKSLGEASDEEAELLADAEVTAGAGRPSYTVASLAIRGNYTSNDGCAGGFDACYSVSVTRSGTETLVTFGDPKYDTYSGKAWSRGGVVLFSIETGEQAGDCDNPGCGDLTHISGVIYPVKVGTEWVPRIKASYLGEFLHPEEQGDPDGEVRSTVRFAHE